VAPATLRTASATGLSLHAAAKIGAHATLRTGEAEAIRVNRTLIMILYRDVCLEDVISAILTVLQIAHAARGDKQPAALHANDRC
jgi:hypothetical protein